MTHSLSTGKSTGYAYNRTDIVTVGYAYDSYGNLSSITAGNTKVWEFASNNGLKYTATLGGTLTSIEERNSQGLLTSQRMLKGSTLLHNMGYTFNGTTGNLTSRSGMLSQTETFGYDSVDRLTSVQHGSTTVMTLTYGANGNITSKTGIGTYSYGTKPHAVTSVTNSGSLIDSNTQSITYTSFDKAASISQGNYQLDITYGTDLQRWKSVLKNNGTVTRTTLYAGDYEKVTENGVTKQYYYLHGGNGLAALYVKQSNASDKVYYPCTDHLGSIIKLVDANGSSVYNATYDAWGQQTVTTNTLNFHRGYTGHEHLSQFALINMNGRMYDPLLGRFLSPDPFVQLPDFSQNFNRYSYCLNNPLVYVDPDGEWIWLVAGVAGGLINWVSNGADLSWEGLSYFGVGFASGVVTAFCPQAYIGIAAANSVANSVLNQGYTNGFNNISWQQTLFDGAMGGAFATVGGALGEKFGASVQKLFKGVKSPLLREVLVAETIGVPMGAGIGGFMAEMDGNDETSFWDGAWKGAKMSFITSGIGGIANATQYSKSTGKNFWTGKTKMDIAIQRTAENLRIKSTQNFVDEDIINYYLEQMNNGTFDKSNGVAYFEYNGKRIISDGNHRMNAAIKHYLLTGNYDYINSLIYNGRPIYRSPMEYGYGKIYNLPIAY